MHNGNFISSGLSPGIIQAVHLAEIIEPSTTLETAPPPNEIQSVSFNQIEDKNATVPISYFHTGPDDIYFTSSAKENKQGYWNKYYEAQSIDIMPSLILYSFRTSNSLPGIKDNGDESPEEFVWFCVASGSAISAVQLRAYCRKVGISNELKK